MSERTVEDHLREEYFGLLPKIKAVAEELEAQVRFCLLPLSTKLQTYERLEIQSRVKDCESGIQSLRRRIEGATFDRDRSDSYTLASLHDLAGVRVLAFPPGRLIEADTILRERFPNWTPDHVFDKTTSDTLAFKYYGNCRADAKVCGEYQVVSMLTGLFWQVEHAALYKLSPELKGLEGSLEMEERRSAVYEALREFEESFERMLRRGPLNKP